jgi:hypothetical protein
MGGINSQAQLTPRGTPLLLVKSGDLRLIATVAAGAVDFRKYPGQGVGPHITTQSFGRAALKFLEALHDLIAFVLANALAFRIFVHNIYSGLGAARLAVPYSIALVNFVNTPKADQLPQTLTPATELNPGCQRVSILPDSIPHPLI